MKKLTTILTTLVVLFAVPAIFAQAQERPASPASPAQQPDQQTITGCLEKGSGAAYKLTTEGDREISVSGSQDLAKHVGNTVKLTGSPGRGSEQATFLVSKVELVSQNCS